MGFVDQFRHIISPTKTKTSRISLNLSFLILAIFGLIGGGTIYLGYKLILFGTTNGFNFTSDLKGWKLGLASTSPGLFLVLCGSAICLYTLKLLTKMDERANFKSKTLSKPRNSTR